jgi:sec-independent protein translocase protein TatC
MTADPTHASADEEDPVESSRMTLGEHLEELRGRLVRSTVAVLIVFCGLYYFRHEVFRFVQQPHHRAAIMLNEKRTEFWLDELPLRIAAAEARGAEVDDTPDPRDWFERGYPPGAGAEPAVLKERWRVSEDLVYFGPDSGFVLRLRICFWLSLFVAGPYILWQVWVFIAAGLYRHEKGVVYRYFPASVGLFAGGVSFGFYVMVPYALYFLGLDALGEPAINAGAQVADQYLNFLKGLALALGIVFQLPVMMLALARLGLVEPSSFAHFRRHMIVGALVLAAIVTPPDPITQIMMAGPIILLYEVGIHLARWGWRNQSQAPFAPVP